MKEFCRFLVFSCQKLTKILHFSGSVKSFWEACSIETLLYLQPFLSQHCTGSCYCDSRLKASCLDEEAWLDKSPGKFTELLTFPHSNSPGSNWLPLIRFPCCNWQLLIRCCQLLQQSAAWGDDKSSGVGGRTGLNPGPEPCFPEILFQ